MIAGIITAKDMNADITTGKALTAATMRETRAAAAITEAEKPVR